eukprot:4013674-Karenia_brevis.AAC.1
MVMMNVLEDMSTQAMGLYWRRRYAQVTIVVSGQTFVQGFASGNGFNGLIDTLKQQLHVDVN